MKTKNFWCKEFLVLCFLACVMVSCSGNGMTLAEIDKLSPTEQSMMKDLKIVGIEGNGDFDLYELLQNFTNLERLEITKDFTGIIKGKAIHDNLPHLKTFTAKGITAIEGNGMFYGMKELKNVNCPSLKRLGLHVFHKCSNIETLDFPKLADVDMGGLGELKSLKVLKIGAKEEMICTSSYGNYGTYIEGTPTRSVDLFLGDYEFNNNVRNENGNSYWRDIQFKSISLYK
ncbi:leucine-rich repeat protein [Phocaeicola sp.]